MKKKFTEPKLQVKRFESMDVIATSGPQKSPGKASFANVEFEAGTYSTGLNYKW